MNINKILSYSLINVLRLSGKVELYQPTYNPNNYPFLVSDPSKRICADRLKAMTDAIDFSKVDSYVDIGCQIGYFVFSLASTYPNLQAHGIDQELASSLYNKALHKLYTLENCNFSRLLVDKNTVKDIKPATVISLLSVWHHIVYNQGKPSGDRIIQELRKKCKYFVFETGQFDEKGMPWTQSLDFMGNDPDTWLVHYLKEHKFTIIHKQLFETHLSSVKRVLYICQ